MRLPLTYRKGSKYLFKTQVFTLKKLCGINSQTRTDMKLTSY